MSEGFDGVAVVDPTGTNVGTVERTYIDDSGDARYVAVKIGTLLAKHRLVPVDSSADANEPLQVAYTKDVIESSPSIDSGDTLEGEPLQSVRDYYDGVDSSSSGTDDEGTALETSAIEAIGESDQRSRPANDYPEIPTQETPARFGEVRDRGDVIEIPIVEEVLVKKPIVREVLRVRKSRTTETGTAAVDLRREDVEVIPSGVDVVDRREDADAE